jgi:hypothetical protein
MFHPYMSLYTTILFVLLVPGVIFTIPIKGSKLVTVLLHGVVFAILFHFTHKAVWNTFYEHFATGAQATPPNTTPRPTTLAQAKATKEAEAKAAAAKVAATNKANALAAKGQPVPANVMKQIGAPVCRETCSNKFPKGVCCKKNKDGKLQTCMLKGNKQYGCM